MSKESKNIDSRSPSFIEETEKNWKRIQNDYRKRHPSLNEEDTTYRSGEFEDMTERIAMKTNRTRMEVQAEINSWGYTESEGPS
ncbi:MAG: hypothetical protein CMC08_00170 [Flavobacteriaceae bacterium]|nr:hypothetical protein [Flavobacteriaceae bacterium]|tara:strand:- start:391 stop:642 length:252 start_codon:yes stop_codon:yes gene_type:complete